MFAGWIDNVIAQWNVNVVFLLLFIFVCCFVIIKKWLLQGYFARNPRERDLLEKDKKLQALNLKSPAIADVPDYIGQSQQYQIDNGLFAN